jgi:hypothetical protein
MKIPNAVFFRFCQKSNFPSNKNRLWYFINPVSGEIMKNKADKNQGVLYRHGDVLVAKIDAIPEDAVKRNHLVLAEGEMTGHSHRIAEAENAQLYQSGPTMYLRVSGGGATLIHQEHGPITLPEGEYRVWRQREYSPQEIRVVRD